MTILIISGIKLLVVIILVGFVCIVQTFNVGSKAIEILSMNRRNKCIHLNTYSESI